MFELEILKNVSRKRTSTNTIKKDEESRKKVCETTKKEITHDNITKDETVARKLFMYYQKTEKRTEEKKRFIERKSRQRVRLLSCDQKCCSCEDKSRFRINEVCSSYEHRQCVECLIQQLKTTNKRIEKRTSSEENMKKT